MMGSGTGALLGENQSLMDDEFAWDSRTKKVIGVVGMSILIGHGVISIRGNTRSANDSFYSIAFSLSLSLLT